MTSGNYLALPKLEIEGQSGEKMKLVLEDIVQIIVEESLHLPAMFTIVIRNDYFPGGQDEKKWKHQDLLEFGKKVKIGFTSSTTESQDFSEEKEGYLIEGEITAIETHFTEKSQAPIVIRGYDISHRLHRGRWNRSFQGMTDSDIVKKILAEVVIEPGQIDESGIPHEYVFQNNQTNMEFLRERAARIGFELFVQDGKLNFRRPTSTQNIKLTWLTDLHSFRVRVTSAEQVKEVNVRAWDYKQKKPIVSTRNSENVLTKTENGRGSVEISEFKGKPTKPTVYIIDQPISTPKEADAIAQALFDELGGQFVYADAQGEGNPNIRPGRTVTLEELGKHNGSYYVTETRHTYFERVYTTEFSVRGLRGSDLLTTLSPPTRLQPGQTFLVGIVTDNQDPEGLGRVKVWFPTLTPKTGENAHASHWARVVAIGAGKGRGFDCLPEINDEVLVAFEHGNIHRPYILGGVWNGQDLPPKPVAESVRDGNVRVRTFKTRTGHQIQFIEEDRGDSKAGVYIETTTGHQIQLNDSENAIEVQTKGKHKLRLDDQNGCIEIKTISHTIRMDTAGISLNSAGNIDIQANGVITVLGSFIKLN
ncbi:MAG: VgrG-related protein [Cyanobacteria bacterium J06592_8]